MGSRRRDRRHRARSSRQRRAMDGACSASAGSPSGRSRWWSRPASSTGPPRTGALFPHPAGGDRRRVECAGHGHRRDSCGAPRTSRRGAHLRGRGALRAPQPGRRARHRLRLPRLLGLQVLRSAHRCALRPEGADRGARRTQARTRARERSGATGNGNAESRGDRRRRRGGGVPGIARQGSKPSRAARKRVRRRCTPAGRNCSNACGKDYGRREG